MSIKNEAIDLCTNCMNRQKCFYKENKTGPIQFCEGFACEAGEASLKDIERFNRAKTLFLPKTAPKLFDDCGRAGERP